MDKGRVHSTVIKDPALPSSKGSWDSAGDVEKNKLDWPSTRSDDTDPHMMLRAKPWLVKHKYLTRQRCRMKRNKNTCSVLATHRAGRWGFIKFVLNWY